MRVVIANEAQADELIAVGRAVHAGDPGWVPPFEASLKAELLGHDAWTRAGGRVLPLLVEDGAGRAIGRAAAFLDPRLPGVGMLGHVETEDDPAVLRALLDAARPWLREQGAQQLWAPIAGGAHRFHRAMLSGFEAPAFFLEPRTARWLPRDLEACGLAPVHRWGTWEVEGRALGILHERVERAAKRADDGLVLERPDPLDPATIGRLHALLDRVWAGHVGYVSLGPEELLETFGGLLALVARERTLALVVQGGQDVGLGFLYPDVIDAVRAVDGDAARFGEVLAAPRPRRCVIHTVALAPEVRGAGAPHFLWAAALRHLRDSGYESVLLALASADALRSLARIGPPQREHALFAGPA